MNKLIHNKSLKISAWHCARCTLVNTILSSLGLIREALLQSWCWKMRLCEQNCFKGSYINHKGIKNRSQRFWTVWSYIPPRLNILFIDGGMFFWQLHSAKSHVSLYCRWTLSTLLRTWNKNWPWWRGGRKNDFFSRRKMPTVQSGSTF